VGFFLLDPYLTRSYVLLKIQHVCSTGCETTPKNDTSNRHKIYYLAQGLSQECTELGCICDDEVHCVCSPN